jgi:hypothetical protein
MVSVGLSFLGSLNAAILNMRISSSSQISYERNGFASSCALLFVSFIWRQDPFARLSSIHTYSTTSPPPAPKSPLRAHLVSNFGPIPAPKSELMTKERPAQSILSVLHSSPTPILPCLPAADPYPGPCACRFSARQSLADGRAKCSTESRHAFSMGGSGGGSRGGAVWLRFVSRTGD